MIAYKGFNRELTSIFGDGKKKNCVFVPGETKETDYSKTTRSGYHCCENPFECLIYYPLNGKNRYFIVDAGGSIDEEEGARISCTRITLLEEMTPLKLAMEGMKYIINHPDRSGWEQNMRNVSVKQDKAEVKESLGIAIARGTDPKVKGVEGSIMGLIVEDETGIRDCKLFVADAGQSGKWYRLNGHRELEVAG